MGQAQVASLNVKNKLLIYGSNTHAQNSVRNNPFISESTTQLHKNGFLRRGELGELYVRYDIAPIVCLFCRMQIFFLVLVKFTLYELYIYIIFL